nr:uncharacterized mitochondrial protein AtMg00810-like [Tanacetum cinerariifolium]
FEELHGEYVAFGGNPKGGKIFGKGKIRTGKLDFDDVYSIKELKFNLFSVSHICDKKNSVLFTDIECLVLSLEFMLPDENQVLLRVHREKNMYNVDLMNIVPSGYLTCLFAKETLDESNLWHRRFTWVVFLATKDETSPILKTFITAIENQLNLKNTDDDAAFGGKKHEFKGRKLEYEVHVSPSSSSQTKKHDDKTKREAKGKSHVESSTRYRNLSVEFEDFSDNSINEVNAIDSPVPIFGQISTNSTNTFSAIGPSNAVASLTHGKYSYVNTSQYPNDRNMPELEDITYSDDEEDVGAKADFTNLETTITVSPILTTRVHKDHHVTQIIGDLSLATQTRSMKRVANGQGGHSQINNDDFHTCMFACFHSQEEPKRVHQALKDPSWIEAMQEELLQFKMHKVWVLVDLLNGKRAIAFVKLMKDKFQMSSMGELTFFLGLQVKQKPDGIFISQDKYVVKILRKFSLTDGKSASKPIDTKKPLLKDPDGEDVDVHTYRSMIGSLMYLTSSRPDIMFALCACACF